MKRYSYCKFTIEEEQQIIEDYVNGVGGGTVLGRKYGCSIRADNSHLRIHGNLEFLTAVAEYIGEEYKISSDKSIYTLSYSLPISRKLLKRFYKDSKIHLQRKYNLAKKHFCPIT